VFAAERIHGDDTTVPVGWRRESAAPVAFGPMSLMIVLFGGKAPPAAVFFYAADRAGIYPERHLASYGPWRDPSGRRLCGIQ